MLVVPLANTPIQYSFSYIPLLIQASLRFVSDIASRLLHIHPIQYILFYEPNAPTNLKTRDKIWLLH
jgi:hypothetical protein